MLFRAMEKQIVTFKVEGPISRGDLPGLCARICALFQSTAADIALCDCTTVEPDAVTVEALARLQLAAHRNGCQVRLINASQQLLELVAYMGLTDVLPA